MRSLIFILLIGGIALGQVHAQCVPNYFIFRNQVKCNETGTPVIHFTQEQWVGHDIFRRNPGESTWSVIPYVDDYWGNPQLTQGTMIPTLILNTYQPANHPQGSVYEYAFTRQIENVGTFKGYIMAGCKVPAKSSRGKVLLVIEQQAADSLTFELNRYIDDLIQDGFEVSQILVNATDTPSQVKQSIVVHTSSWSATQERYITLIGTVPVPYSGWMMNDDLIDHRGAWPSDVYYAEMDMDWTDTLINNTNVNYPMQNNAPGDGKFDQNLLSSAPDFNIGRIDFSNLPCFTTISEIGLLKRYFDKNHAFRMGSVAINREGYINSWMNYVINPNPTYGGFTEYYGKIGENNFPALTDSMFASYQNLENTFIQNVAQNSYRLAFYTGDAGFSYITNIATASTFNSLSSYNAVFNWSFGHYFGDWNTTCNFGRMMLGAPGTSLTHIWAGNPSQYFHMFGIDYTIGQTIRINQYNHRNNYHNLPLPSMDNYYQRTHIALMGDPTLRLHYELPVLSLSQNTGASGEANFQWLMPPSCDSARVYRSASAAGPFQLIGVVATNTFSDPAPLPDSSFYMVRAQRLHVTGSGSYYNLSEGARVGFSNTSALSAMQTASSELCLDQDTAQLHYVYSPALENSASIVTLTRNSQTLATWSFDLAPTGYFPFNNSTLMSGDTVVLRTQIIGYPQFDLKDTLYVVANPNAQFSWSTAGNAILAEVSFPESTTSYSWLSNGFAIGNGPQINLPIQSQAQILQLEAWNSCGTAISEQEIDPMITSLSTLPSHWIIYPNPSSGMVRLSNLEAVSLMPSVRVMDLQGRMYPISSPIPGAWNLAPLSPGYYLMEFTLSTGESFIAPVIRIP